ncbi:DeoR/GlpR family DNA-binding transcription regulator [Sphingobacterium spiritivorum]|uniref:DeoR/GlpR family DNA-binding transcription regulator n=1 Tax=Sphingobacterium spiritivorum TaxID=258 RepID=UPI003DA37FD5
MLKQERLSTILNELHKRGVVSYAELSAVITASEDTVRRDIKELDSQGLLKAVRGGATTLSKIPHHYRQREIRDIEEKKIIARKALSLIKHNQLLFFDGGTSALELAKILPQDLRATIITNSFPVANVLEDHPTCELLFLGGRLSKTAFATYGNETLLNIQKFRADYYFFGVSSITPEELYCKDLEDAEMKREIIANSTNTIGLCTSDKLNSTDNYYVTKTKSLHMLITECDPDSAILEHYSTIGVEVR